MYFQIKERPEFGKLTKTKVIDANGSTISREATIFKGQEVPPIVWRYDIRARVNTQQEEHEAYLEFSDMIKADKSKLDAAWHVDHSKLGDEQGFYYVVASYSELEY